MEGRNLIKSSQMALFTFVAQTGVGLTMLPTRLAREIGHDGWISVFLTGFAVIVLSALIVVLLKRYVDKDIYDINSLLYGKIIGKIINLILVIYLIGAAVLSTRLLVVVVRVTFFP